MSVSSLEDGGVDLLVPELERGTNRSCFYSVPDGLVVRKDVGDTAWHPVVSLFSHFSPILCSPIVRTSDCWAGYGALIDFRIRNRGMAQSGSALDWGSRGHRFKSCCPDHSFWPCWARYSAFSTVMDVILAELWRLPDQLNVEFKGTFHPTFRVVYPKRKLPAGIEHHESRSL